MKLHECIHTYVDVRIRGVQEPCRSSLRNKVALLQLESLTRAQTCLAVVCCRADLLFWTRQKAFITSGQNDGLSNFKGTHTLSHVVSEFNVAIATKEW